MKVMVITPRFANRLLELLGEKFAGDPEIVVYRDRRVGQRRRRTMMREVSRRRRSDRRVRNREEVAWLIAVNGEVRADEPAQPGAN